MTLNVKYKDFDIMFIEHLDQWVCTELDIQNISLESVKNKINGTILLETKCDIPVYYIGWNETKQARIKRILPADKAAWISYPDKNRGPNGVRRERVKIETLAWDNVEVAEAIRHTSEEARRIRMLSEANSAAREAIPRLTVAELQEKIGVKVEGS